MTDGADQYFTSKQELKEKELYIFKEKFSFMLQTGFEELSVKIYSVSTDDEKEEDAFIIKLADHLVELVD